MSNYIRSLIMALPLAATTQFANAAEIFFIDSYHEGYEWSDGITEGVKKTLENSGHNLTIHRMDTKNNPSEEFKVKAGKEAYEQIKAKKPDVVIACDDNASKYIVEPFLKGTETPVVFCGLNWDASSYGFPTDNVTGVLEVAAADELIELMLPFAKGKRVGLLSADTESERKEHDNISKLFGDKFEFTQNVLVKNMADFEEAFIDIQTKSDLVVIVNYIGIEGWDDEKGKAIIDAHTTVPVGSVSPWVSPYVLVTFSKIPAEQGRRAAEYALKIIDGTKVSDLPVTRNVEGQLVLNARIAQKLNIELPAELIEAAGKVIE